MKRFLGVILNLQRVGSAQKKERLAADEFLFLHLRPLPQPGQGALDPAGIFADKPLNNIEGRVGRGAHDQRRVG